MNIVLGVITGALGLILIAVLFHSRTTKKRWENKVAWYISMLDSIPFPISVTDNNRNWTFVNKPVEDLLKQKRSELIGKQCNYWGASICNTPNCGLECLKNNKERTFFDQLGMDFQVDVKYLFDTYGNAIGHIEVVQDITALKKTIRKQEHIISELTIMAEQLSSSADQIASGAQTMSQSSTEQASSIEELSASINEMANQIRSNADNSNKASELSNQSSDSVTRSNVQMQNLMLAMNDISSKSNEIGKIIKTIDDIAFQTNILALNAAVEAARAGAAGKGFAVVADEVRNLAAKSAEAANNTTTLIESSIAAINNGATIAENTSKELLMVVDGAKSTDQLIKEITVSSNNQATAIEQIRIGIEQISAVVQTNSATSEESAAASEELASQATQLKNLVLS
jgi:methyl-accepting chemotaxis protein